MVYYSVYSPFLSMPHYFSMSSAYQDDGFGNAVVVGTDMDEWLIACTEEDLH